MWTLNPAATVYETSNLNRDGNGGSSPNSHTFLSERPAISSCTRPGVLSALSRRLTRKLHLSIPSPAFSLIEKSKIIHQLIRITDRLLSVNSFRSNPSSNPRSNDRAPCPSPSPTPSPLGRRQLPASAPKPLHGFLALSHKLKHRPFHVPQKMPSAQPRVAPGCLQPLVRIRGASSRKLRAASASRIIPVVQHGVQLQQQKRGPGGTSPRRARCEGQ